MLRLALFLMTATLATTAAAVAHAQSCGGENDDGSSDGDDSFSDDDTGGSAGTSDVEVCTDTTEITGLEECTRFGRGWDVSSAPGFSIGLSLGMRRVSLDDIAVGGTSMHDENPYRWNLRGDELDDPDMNAVVFGLRASLFLTDYAYVGVELGLGGGSASGPAIDTGELTLRPTSALVLTGAGAAGVSLPLGQLALRLEVLAGVRALSLHFESRLADCVTSTTAWSATPLVEPRVVLDFFTSPWLTVGAYAGADVLDALAWHAGMSVALHARSYDGQ